MNRTNILSNSYYIWWKNIDKVILTLIGILIFLGIFFSLVSIFSLAKTFFLSRMKFVEKRINLDLVSGYLIILVGLAYLSYNWSSHAH